DAAGMWVLEGTPGRAVFPGCGLRPYPGYPARRVARVSGAHPGPPKESLQAMQPGCGYPKVRPAAQCSPDAAFGLIRATWLRGGKQSALAQPRPRVFGVLLEPRPGRS